MSSNRLGMPARIAGVVSFCMAAAVGAQTASPGTANPNNTNRSTATSSQSPASPAARSDAMGSNAAQRASSNAMGSNNATAKAIASSVSSGDRKFMEKAAQGGMAEVELGKLATEKASAPEVKQFGQRMVDDHSKANDQLKQIATRKGVNLPTDIDRSTKREMDKLARLSGADFDREYMKHMVSDHKKDVSEFKSEAGKAKDADVKQFAASTEPTLEQHLHLAQSAEQAAESEGKSAPKTSSRSTTKTGS
jgi:putative membrane protein